MPNMFLGNRFVECNRISSVHILLCAVFSGLSLGVEISQTPSDILRNPGDKVQLVCSHEKTDYTQMHWYQKSPGDNALKRIGHVNYNTKDYEESYKEHFNITGDMSGQTAKNGSLFIVDLKAPDHSAVYYCAASYARRLQIPSHQYKNLYGFEQDREQAPPTKLHLI